jgi:transposase-like protein
MTSSAPPACPFCASSEVERIGQWGGQMITSQWRCGVCGSYFEALRDELGDSPPPSGRGASAVTRT